ncbi:hypothetical protein [Nonomuraea sp. KM90]|uniref:hypothetical protein n=1 Tax=Nonomuraea sp. KM90 TaxID=3457428 RepID=UPI003FCD4214
MTYTPVWPGWVEATRTTISQLKDELTDESARAINDRANHLGARLRAEFADLPPAIIAWITIRVGAHLTDLVAADPEADPQHLAIITLLAGDFVDQGRT